MPELKFDRHTAFMGTARRSNDCLANAKLT